MFRQGFTNKRDCFFLLNYFKETDVQRFSTNGTAVLLPTLLVFWGTEVCFSGQKGLHGVFRVFFFFFFFFFTSRSEEARSSVAGLMFIY